MDCINLLLQKGTKSMLTILLAANLFYWNEFSDIHSAYGPNDWVNYGHGAVPIERHQKRPHRLVIPKRQKPVIVEDLSDIEDYVVSDSESDSFYEDEE